MTTTANTPSKKAVIQVEGMTCQNCVRHVREALLKVQGVAEADVDLNARQATVSYDAAQAGVPAMMGAVNAAGYKAKGFKVQP